MSAFTPTSQLRKRKTYQKRCKFIMQTLEDEKMREIAASSAVVPFRPGDVVRVKVEVLENRRRANWFTGIVIARRNRGMGSSFTLRSVMANVPVERTFPLYAPTIKARWRSSSDARCGGPSCTTSETNRCGTAACERRTRGSGASATGPAARSTRES